MASTPEIHAYLAGPDVFLPDAVAIGEKRKAHLKTLGITGHFPFDNEIPKEAFAEPRNAARIIAAANERMMLDAGKDGRIPVILFNMTPWHGPSMDVGTAFEAGFMSALAHSNPHVIIVGYTDDARPFAERVMDKVYGGAAIDTSTGVPLAPDGHMVENFGMEENLMLVHAIEKTGGKVCGSFEEAAQLARTLAVQKMQARPDAQAVVSVTHNDTVSALPVAKAV